MTTQPSGEPRDSDPVSQAQEQIDATLAGQPQYLTQAQAQQLIQQAVSAATTPLLSQLRGMEGKLDRGLNATRKEAETIATEVLKRHASRQELDTWYASLDEDDQRKLGPIYRRIAEQMPQPEQARSNTVTSNVVTEQAVDPYVGAKAIVQSIGLDPNDARINYELLNPGTLAAQTQFMAQVGALLRGAPSSQPRQPGATPKPQSANPPIEGTPAPGGYRNIDDVRDAYIKGQLSEQQAQQAATKLGAVL